MEFHDRIYSEENMYRFVQSAAEAKQQNQTRQALPYMKECHRGQFRQGRDHVPYIYHPLLMCCHAIAMGIDDDEILATILLHDVCEDCGKTKQELPVNEKVQEAVGLLSFSILNGKTEEESKKIYYNNISKNRIAIIVKIIDRCNNISTMATAFDREKMLRYMNDTENYILPLLDIIKKGYPEFYEVAFLVEYQMLSVLESLKRTMGFIA